MDFDVKHLKLLKPLVFGKAIGCPGCVLRSEGWVEQSESCHRKRWKLPAKTPAHIRKSQNDGELTFSDSQSLGMAPLGSVALSNDMKHLKLLKSLESGNSWIFPGEWISRYIIYNVLPTSAFVFTLAPYLQHIPSTIHGCFCSMFHKAPHCISCWTMVSALWTHHRYVRPLPTCRIDRAHSPREVTDLSGQGWNSWYVMGQGSGGSSDIPWILRAGVPHFPASLVRFRGTKIAQETVAFYAILSSSFCGCGQWRQDARVSPYPRVWLSVKGRNQFFSHFLSSPLCTTVVLWLKHKTTLIRALPLAACWVRLSLTAASLFAHLLFHFGRMKKVMTVDEEETHIPDKQ